MHSDRRQAAYRHRTVAAVLMEFWQRNPTETLTEQDALVKAQAALHRPIKLQAVRDAMRSMLVDGVLAYDQMEHSYSLRRR